MKLFLILCQLCFLTLTFAQGDNQANSKMPIIAWGGVPPYESSIARFEEMKNAGIDISLTRSTSIDTMSMMLDMAAKAGVKLFVRCPELETMPESVVKRFMNHPATAGYFLKDEPPAKDFQRLGNWNKTIRSVDSYRPAYLNLLPNYAPPEQLGAKNYEQYVDEFVKIVDPSFLSFDNYPVIESKGKRTLRPEWFENLEIIARKSKETSKPFYAFALSVAHAYYPIPAIAEIRLQVFANLVYGAQGIQYFTYWTPRNKSQYNYHTGPIDDANKKSEVYYIIKQVNEEIKGLSDVFLSAKMISVEHVGNNIPIGTKKLSNLPGIIKNIDVNGGCAIVSVIEKDTRRFIAIVNRDFEKEMQLTIRSKKRLKRVLKNGDTISEKRLRNSVMVPPGDIVVYRIK